MFKYMFLGGSAQIITILHRGVIEIYYNITMNLYYVIYGRPLKSLNIETDTRQIAFKKY